MPADRKNCTQLHLLLRGKTQPGRSRGKSRANECRAEFARAMPSAAEIIYPASLPYALLCRGGRRGSAVPTAAWLHNLTPNHTEYQNIICSICSTTKCSRPNGSPKGKRKARSNLREAFILAGSPARGGKFIGRGGAPAEPLCWRRPHHSSKPR